MATVVQEDYLRAISLLSSRGEGKIGVTELSLWMHLAKSTVSERLRSLVELGLVLQHRYGSVELTSKGKSIAERLTYRHRLIECFLHDVLGVSKKKLHEEADRLEHAFSDESIKRIRALLNNPSRCPHGRLLKPVST
ncbi:TPA: metal-dependent transcriptional regulator [Candidatus Woesearchaeota archaeon]|nr:metal-dependent transcriptional regulator [Candidatus Woesearchaeota archaeon]HII68858.1 metal-dependent transcriptional regulator [Candidatus Woesearchaeota archaeon]